MFKFSTMLLYAALVLLLIGSAASAASREVACLGIDCPRNVGAGSQATGEDGIKTDITINNFGSMGDVTVQTDSIQNEGASAETYSATEAKKTANKVKSNPVTRKPAPVADDCLEMDCTEQPPAIQQGEATCEQTREEFIETFGLFVWVPATRNSGFLPQDDGAYIPSAQSMIRNIGEVQFVNPGDEIPPKVLADKVRKNWEGPLVTVTTSDPLVTSDQSGQTQQTILVTFAANWRGNSKVVECYQLIINERGYLDFDLAGAVNVDGYPSVNEITTISAVDAYQMPN